MGWWWWWLGDGGWITIRVGDSLTLPSTPFLLSPAVSQTTIHSKVEKNTTTSWAANDCLLFTNTCGVVLYCSLCVLDDVQLGPEVFGQGLCTDFRLYSRFTQLISIFRGSKVIGQTNIIITITEFFHTWMKILSSQWLTEVWSLDLSLVLHECI